MRYFFITYSEGGGAPAPIKWLDTMTRGDSLTVVACAPAGKPPAKRSASKGLRLVFETEEIPAAAEKTCNYTSVAANILERAEAFKPDAAHIVMGDEPFPAPLFESIRNLWLQSYEAQDNIRLIPELRIFEPGRKQAFRDPLGTHLQPECPAEIDDWEFLPALLDDEEMRAVRIAISSAANVLILGDIGAGKSQVARYIHYRTQETAGGAFHAFNFTAIPDSLFESHMFGAIRGAYTDSKETRPGAMQIADKGSLFLDEIAAMEGLQFKQAKLLEVVRAQYRPCSFLPVGAQERTHALVRFLAATNCSLDQLAGVLRSDLLSRFPIQVRLKHVYEKRPDPFEYFLRAVRHFTMCDFTFNTIACPEWNVDALRKCYLQKLLPANLRDLRSMVFRIWLNRIVSHKIPDSEVDYPEIRNAAQALAGSVITPQRAAAPGLHAARPLLNLLRDEEQYNAWLCDLAQVSPEDAMEIVYRLKRLALDVALAHAGGRPNLAAMRTFGMAKHSSFKALHQHPERLHPDRRNRPRPTSAELSS